MPNSYYDTTKQNYDSFYSGGLTPPTKVPGGLVPTTLADMYKEVPPPGQLTTRSVTTVPIDPLTGLPLGNAGPVTRVGIGTPIDTIRPEASQIIDGNTTYFPPGGDYGYNSVTQNYETKQPGSAYTFVPAPHFAKPNSAVAAIQGVDVGSPWFSTAALRAAKTTGTNIRGTAGLAYQSALAPMYGGTDWTKADPGMGGIRGKVGQSTYQPGSGLVTTSPSSQTIQQMNTNTLNKPWSLANIFAQLFAPRPPGLPPQNPNVMSAAEASTKSGPNWRDDGSYVAYGGAGD